MQAFASPIVALLTPFDARGNIAWQAFESYLTALSAWGVRSVITNGTTAEFSSLTLDERQRVAEFVRHHFQGTVINNVSSPCVNDARKLIHGTIGFSDAVMILPPYYYAGVHNDGLCRFFEKALSGVSLPIFLYHFPQHTGNRIDNDLIEMLLARDIQISGIKDSGGKLDNALAYQSRFPKLQLYYANDAQALEALQRGLTGLVSGGANPLPEFLIALQKYFGKSNEEAKTLQGRFNTWNDYRTASPLFEIPLVKAAMGARTRNFPVHVRPPFTPASAKEIRQVRNTVFGCLADLRGILERLS